MGQQADSNCNTRLLSPPAFSLLTSFLSFVVVFSPFWRESVTSIFHHSSNHFIRFLSRAESIYLLVFTAVLYFQVIIFQYHSPNIFHFRVLIFFKSAFSTRSLQLTRPLHFQQIMFP